MRKRNPKQQISPFLNLTDGFFPFFELSPPGVLPHADNHLTKLRKRPTRKSKGKEKQNIPLETHLKHCVHVHRVLDLPLIGFPLFSPAGRTGFPDFALIMIHAHFLHSLSVVYIDTRATEMGVCK